MTELSDYEKISTTPNVKRYQDYMKIRYGCAACGTKKGLVYSHVYGVVLCKECEEDMGELDNKGKNLGERFINQNSPIRSTEKVGVK